MKLVNYRCRVCGTDTEEYFDSDEEIPEVLEELCDGCDAMGTLEKFNFKANDQVQKFVGEW